MKVNSATRTVFLIRNVAPETYGGSEIYQLKIAEQLRQHGFVPIIVTNSRCLLKESRRLRIGTLEPPYSRNQNWSGWRNLMLPRYVLFQKKLKKWYECMFDRYKPAVINVQSRDDMIAATVAARGRRIQILWTDHADFVNWVLWNVNVPLKNMIGRKIIKLSQEVDRVIFVSQNLRQQTEKMIAPKKVLHTEVIENGVKDEASEYRSCHEKKKSFVFLGRVTRDKGVGELVEAFRIVKTKYTDAELNIYGDRGLGEKAETDVDGVVFHGRADDPLKALAENEVFVLPSYKEGLSIALIEAAMMGKKIIATDVGGNSEVVQNGKTGLLIQSNNVEELITAMLVMLRDRGVDNMGAAARERYEQKFDLEKVFTEKMLPLYNIEKEK